MDGNYLIGRGDSCDVLLTDEQLAEEHVRLNVANGAVTASMVDDNLIYIDGESAADAVLQKFQYLTVGSTHLAFGPADEEWPMAPLPTIVVHPEAEERTSEDETDDVTSSEEASETAPAAETTADASTTPRVASQKARWVFATVLIALLGCGGLLVFQSIVTSMAERPDVATTNIEDLRDIVSSVAPDSNVTVSQNDDLLKAEGYVLTKATADKLERSLTTAAADIDTDEIRDTESIASVVRGLLKLRKLTDLDVSPADSPGDVVVSGVLESLDEWKKASRDIRAKTSINELIDQVMLPEQAAAVAAAKVEEIPSAAPVSSTPPASPITVVARPAPKTQATTSAGPVRLPFRITDVTIGRNRFFTIDDGTKVSEKSIVRAHYVKSIEPDRISLVKEGREFVVRLDL